MILKHLDLYGVRHDQRQKHPHGPQHVGEEVLHLYNMGIFKISCFSEMCLNIPWDCHGSP